MDPNIFAIIISECLRTRPRWRGLKREPIHEARAHHSGESKMAARWPSLQGGRVPLCNKHVDKCSEASLKKDALHRRKYGKSALEHKRALCYFINTATVQPTFQGPENKSSSLELWAGRDINVENIQFNIARNPPLQHSLYCPLVLHLCIAFYISVACPPFEVHRAFLRLNST